MTSDMILLHRYIESRDADAFTEIVRRHSGMVFNVALRMLRNADDAEDVAQECFMDLVNHASKIHSLPGWLHTSARFRSAKVIRSEVARRQRHQKKGEEETVVSRENWPEIEEDIDEGLAVLPEETRELMVLYYLEGRKQDEIAEMTGLERSSISRTLSKGVESLRVRLRKTGYVIPAVALGEMMLVNCMHDVPATLVAKLGKLAISGIGSSAGTVSGGISAVKIAVGIAAAVALGVGTTVVTMKSGSGVNKPSNTKAWLGAADFFPSPERPVGWRGDWTGQFRGATPPLHWGMHLKSPLRYMRSSAAKPEKPEDGRSMPDGIVKDWLIAGPFKPTDMDKAVDEEFLDPAAIHPVEGGKAGDKTWTLRKTLDTNPGHTGERAIQSEPFDPAPGGAKVPPDENMAYYFHAYVYCRDAGKLRFEQGRDRGPDGGVKIWVNGDLLEVYRQGEKKDDPNAKSKRFKEFAEMRQGWNSLLVKMWFHSRGRAYWLFRWWPPNATADYWRESQKYEYDTENVAWQLPMPARGVATPLILGDKVFVTSEPSSLLCIDRKNGKLLWMRPVIYHDILTDEDKKALDSSPVKAKVEKSLTDMKECEKKIIEKLKTAASSGEITQLSKPFRQAARAYTQAMFEFDKTRFGGGGGDGGPAAYTPCSDGKNVYVLFGTRMLAGIDLDGNVKWVRMHCPNDETHHGFVSSPALVGDKFIVYFRSIAGYDIATGKKEWVVYPEGRKDAPPEGPFYKGTLFWSSVVPVKAAGEQAVYLSPGSVFRARDGKVLFTSTQFGSHICPTPMEYEGTIYHMGSLCDKIEKVTLSQDKGDSANLNLAGTIKLNNRLYYVASPLIHEGLLYNVAGDGALMAVDLKAGKTVYNEHLDLRAIGAYSQSGGVDASLVKAGKYIYALDNRCNVVIFEPGTQFKQVARNILQDFDDVRQDQSPSCPVFAGKDMIIRSDRYVYCIRENQ